MVQSIHKNRIFQKLYANRNDVERMLIISVLFSLALVMGRSIIKGELRFVFLPWNLFLAFVPYFISRKMVNNADWFKPKWKLTIGFLAWLLFIPNSFYILTDLFHLHVSEDIPRWFDLTLILSFAWNGLMLGILSVRQMEKIYLQVFRMKNELIFLYPVMWLIAWGVYIGRYLRFNSWDIITNPFQVISDTGNMIIHPFQNLYAWSMILVFSILMTLIYSGIRRIARTIL